MELTPMRFKTFTWPHNPETYSITFRRRVAAHVPPGQRAVMQDLGMTYRVMEGEGAFAGPDAYEQFKALARVFYQGGPGVLVHPVWQAASAYFVELSLREKPLPDYVRYAFAFWEDRGGGSAALKPVAAGLSGRPGTKPAGGNDYIVKKGDTLWGIAKRFRVTLGALIRANPQIKNPNLIYPGDRVQLP